MSMSTGDPSFVPTDNLHTYLFANKDVFRRFTVRDDQPIFYDYVNEKALLYGRLRDDSLRLASCLSQAVVGCPPKGDFDVPGALVGPLIMMHLPNCLAFPVLLFGALAAGCTVTLVSPALSPTELAHVIGQVQPDIAFTQVGDLGDSIITAAMGLCPVGTGKPRVYTVDMLDYPRRVSDVIKPVSSWLSLLDTKSLYQIPPMSTHEQAHRVAVILWSSGTTGKSKGVMLAHRALVTSIVLWQKHSLDLANPEVWIGISPFYHTMGLETQCILAPMYGAKVVVMRKFDLETYLRLISKHHVTRLGFSPPLALALTKTPLLDEPWCDLSSVRSAGCGAAPLGPDIIREFHRRTGLPILMGYGLTETGCFTHRPDLTWESAERHLGYSGRVMPDVEIKIVDEQGKQVPNGQPGEILMRSDLQMLGYVRNPEATAQTMEKDGFIRTGDIGILSDERFIRIVDRIKDVIKYKGYQVSPVELDAIIGALPSVLDVGVTSVYDESEVTELPVAYVVPRAPDLFGAVKERKRQHQGLQELAEVIRKVIEEKCAHYKRLRGGIIFCEAITKSPTGKIVRRSLKDVKGIHVDIYPRSDMRAKL